MKDKSREEKFVDIVAEIVRLTENSTLFDEIIEAIQQNTETIQLLEQAYDTKDDMLNAIDQTYNIRQVEITLREQEAKLRSELKQNITLLRTIKRAAAAKARYNRLKNQVDFEKSQARTQEMHQKWEEISKSPHTEGLKDFYKSLAEFYKSAEDFYKSTLNTKPVLDFIAKKSYTSTKVLVDGLISSSRMIILKYTWKRFSLFLLEQSIRIFWLLILITLLPGILLSKVEPWFLSLLILPGIAWFLTDRFFQPSLERRIFTPRRRSDVKLLVNDFYNKSMLAKCYLAMMKKLIEE